jgi:hypothetical protein
VPPVLLGGRRRRDGTTTFFTAASATTCLETFRRFPWPVAELMRITCKLIGRPYLFGSLIYRQHFKHFV